MIDNLALVMFLCWKKLLLLGATIDKFLLLILLKKENILFVVNLSIALIGLYDFYLIFRYLNCYQLQFSVTTK